MRDSFFVEIMQVATCRPAPISSGFRATGAL